MLKIVWILCMAVILWAILFFNKTLDATKLSKQEKGKLQICFNLILVIALIGISCTLLY